MPLELTATTALIGAALTASGALVTAAGAMVVALINRKPKADQVAFDGFEKLVRRLEAELLGVQEERAKLESLTSELEVEIVRLRAWCDQAVVIFTRMGIEHPPLPRPNGAARAGRI